MPILETIKTTIEQIDKLCISTAITLTSDHVVNYLKKNLEKSIEEKNDDFSFSSSDLSSLKLNCDLRLDEPFASLIDQLISYLDEQIKERQKLLSPTLDFLYVYKTIDSENLIDYIKMEPVLTLCKNIFKTDDLFSFLQGKTLEELLTLLSASKFFMPQLLQPTLIRKQERYEKAVVSTINLRIKNSPTRFKAGHYTLTPEMEERFAQLKLYGKNPFAPRSAPNSSRTPMVSPEPRMAISEPTSPHKVESADTHYAPNNELNINNRLKPKSVTNSVSPTNKGVPPLRFSQSAILKPKNEKKMKKEEEKEQNMLLPEELAEKLSILALENNNRESKYRKKNKT